ncbi:MAG: hypothetical protein SOZ83_02670, partial [Sphaerochaetaceae bacterium]|nr:hypothetical protein [Sphaerochaetaceae bacterium]
MSKKRVLIVGLIISSLLFLSLSCSDIFSTLNKLGVALDNSGVNVFGYNGVDKQVESTIDALFDNEEAVFGKTKIDLISGTVNKLMKNFDDNGTFNTSNLTKEDGSISVDNLYNAYIKDLAMKEEEFSSFVSDIANLKSAEAKEKFAKKMREPAGLKLDGELLPENVKDRVEQFKEVITKDKGMDENVKTVVNAIIDTIVNKDGEFTKGTVVILSSAATVIDKMLTVSKEVSLDNIDTQDLMMKMSSDLVNFAIISFAVIGEDTDEG